MALQAGYTFEEESLKDNVAATFFKSLLIIKGQHKNLMLF